MARTWRGPVLASALVVAVSACDAPAPRARPEAPEGVAQDGVPPAAADAPIPGAVEKTGEDVTVVFHWALYVRRTRQPARETVVGYVHADGSPGGVVLVNDRGTIIQPIPGADGADAEAVAARWLKARGWGVLR